MSKRQKRNQKPAVEATATVETPVTEAPAAEPTTEAPTTEAPAVEPTTEAPAADAPTETATAKRNRRFTVGSAVDTTVYALNPESEPKARPLTLAGALYDELKVNGPGTVAELVDRLNASGQYEKVAIKSATLRPYSSVAYWLKTWRAAGHTVVVIADAVEAKVEAPVAVEEAVDAQ